MQAGEYITERLMVGIIKNICAERGIVFASLSDDWVLELSKNDMIRRVIGYNFSLNDAVAASIAKDKVATHLVLNRAGVPSVPHALLRPKVSEVQRKAIKEWQKIVVKPLEGTSGYGVKLVGDASEAVAWVEATEIPAWAASPFIDIKREMRFVLLDQQPLIVFEKQAVTIDGLKMFNLGQGAAPKNFTPSVELLELAARAQSALGLRICAVDIVESLAGETMVLEVNSGFMMEHYMRSSPEHMQQAVEAYNNIITAVMEE